MVLKSKLPKDVPPWARETVPTKELTPAERDNWDWHDWLAAELAVDAARKELRRNRACQAELEEFADVWRYVARKGLLDFNIAFLRELYFQWRFGVASDEY